MRETTDNGVVSQPSLCGSAFLSIGNWLENYLENSFCVLVDKVKASLGNLVKKLLFCICLVFLGLVGKTLPLLINLRHSPQ